MYIKIDYCYTLKAFEVERGYLFKYLSKAKCIRRFSHIILILRPAVLVPEEFCNKVSMKLLRFEIKATILASIFFIQFKREVLIYVIKPRKHFNTSMS